MSTQATDAAAEQQPDNETLTGRMVNARKLEIEGEVASAVAAYRELAALGFADGMVHLGRCALNGIGMEVDIGLAIGTLRAAVAKGSRPAHYFLALALYEHGGEEGAEEALATASHYLDGSVPRISCLYARMMLEGRAGYPCNKEQGLSWLTRTAELGLPEAQFRLGMLIHEEEGIDSQRLAEAARWCQMGLEGGWPDAAGWQQNQAAEWYRRLSASGDAEAHYQLGGLYLRGIGVQRDQSRGLNHLEHAANHGHLAAALYLTTVAADREDGLADRASALFERLLAQAE
jgi:TPR repeat protein